MGNKIQQGIRECDVLVVCASPHALESDWVWQEIQWAQEQKSTHKIRPNVVVAIVQEVGPDIRKKIAASYFIDLTCDSIHGIRRLIHYIKQYRKDAEANCRCKVLTGFR